MIEWFPLFASFALGGVLAAAYLWALWLTVKRVRGWRHPALGLIGSFVVRTAVLVAAFAYIVRDGHWERLIAALAGFVLVRTLVVACARRVPSSSIGAHEEELP